MPQPSLLIVDCARFAREAGRVDGEIDGTRLRRVAPLLERVPDTVAFEARGAVDNGKPVLTLSVRADLVVRCQRCLGELPLPVRIDSRLLLVPPGGDWPDEELADDSFDAIEAPRELDLLNLIEDEVLLALPLSPRHAFCEVPDHRRMAQPPSPFAALARLTRH